MQQSSFKIQQHLDLANQHNSYDRLDAVLFVKDDAAILAILANNTEIVRCQTFFNSDLLAEDIFLRLLFEKEPILREAFRSFRIYTGHTSFALAPISSVPERQLLHYARLVLNDALFEEEFAFGKILSINSWIVFSVPISRKHIIESYRPDAYFGHIGEVFIDFSKTLQEENFTLVSLYDQSAIVLAYKDGHLKLCNLYNFRANSDLLYFLHSVRKATHLEGDEIPTLIMGDLDGRMKEIKEHFPNVQVPQTLMDTLDAKFIQRTPYWQFAFLAWGQVFSEK